MKRLILIAMLFLLIQALFAQRWGPREERLKRLEEFKKIKLIESLELSGDESTKFFTLYNEHQKKVRSIQREREQIFDQLERLTKSESRFNEKKFEDLEKRLNQLDQELFRNRQEFYLNLKNVLAPFKVAKFYVFEREFMREVNRLIMMKKNRDNSFE